MNTNTFVIGLIIYSIVSTCYLFGLSIKKDELPFLHCILNAMIAVVVFAIVYGLIKVFIFLQ